MQIIDAEKKSRKRSSAEASRLLKKTSIVISSGLKVLHYQYKNEDFYTVSAFYYVKYCDTLSEKLHDWVQCEGR
jgi:hypothetical protein